MFLKVWFIDPGWLLEMDITVTSSALTEPKSMDAILYHKSTSLPTFLNNFRTN